MYDSNKCAICGKETKLTFEHIPPRNALNNTGSRVITGDEFINLMSSENRMPWDTTGLHYVNQQRGAGLYSLCKSCNNLTGTFYGDEYCKVANAFAYYMQEHEKEVKECIAINLNVKDMYPLKFIKQVLSMFCSTTLGLTEKYHEIRELILDKDKVLSNPNFKISMFLMKNKRFLYTGQNAELIKFSKIRVLSTMDLYPFGFVFDYDKNYEDNTLCDITSFLTFKYDDCVTMSFCIPLLERNNPFPCDYRTKQEIEDAVKQSKIYKNKK